MNCLNSLLFEDGAIAGVEVGARDTAGVGVEVLLPSVGVALASSSLPVQK